ncbi:MAG: cytochrome c [Pseudomonadota bacterium]
MKSVVKCVAIFSVVGVVGLGCASRVVGGEATPQALFETRCSKCHQVDKALGRTMSPEEWRAVVAKMKDKWFSGIADEEAPIIADYLIKIRGK